MNTLSNLKGLKKDEISNFDIVLVAQIFDGTILSFTDDVSNRYKFSDLDLINLVKVAFTKNMEQISWNLSDSIHQVLENFTVSVSESWTHLLKIRDFANNVRAKMTPNSIIRVDPNSIKVDEKIYSESKKKVYGTNLLLDTLFGIDLNHLKAHVGQWDQLVQVWLYLVFRHATPMTKNWIESFIFDTQIYETGFEEYFAIEAESEWRVLGLYVPPLNKNYKKLFDMLDELFTHPMWWSNHEEFKNKWLEYKNNSLNKNIILQTIKANLDSSALLKGVKHIIADQIDAREYEYEDLKKKQMIPTRNQVLDLPIVIRPSYWTNENKDFTYILSCVLNDQVIGDIIIEIGWHQFTPAKNLKHKIRFQNFNIEALKKPEPVQAEQVAPPSI